MPSAQMYQLFNINSKIYSTSTRSHRPLCPFHSRPRYSASGLSTATSPAPRPRTRGLFHQSSESPVFCLIISELAIWAWQCMATEMEVSQALVSEVASRSHRACFAIRCTPPAYTRAATSVHVDGVAATLGYCCFIIFASRCLWTSGVIPTQEVCGCRKLCLALWGLSIFQGL